MALDNTQPKKPKHSSGASRRLKIDSQTLTKLGELKAMLEGIRTYFLFEVNYHEIGVSDVNQHDKILRDFIAAVDGWKKLGIAVDLFKSLDTVDIKSKAARKHFFDALDLLPPPDLLPPEKKEKRSEDEGNRLFKAFDGLPDVIQAILNEFNEVKKPKA